MKNIKRKIYLLLATIFAAGVAIAATVSIDARFAPYNVVPAAEGIEVDSSADLRVAGLNALAGAYRTLHGALSLPPGSIVKVTWFNGSKEDANVRATTTTPCSTISPIVSKKALLLQGLLIWRNTE